MTRLEFIALLTPSLGSVILVVLAWIYSNARISRLETTMDRNTADLRAEIKSETSQLRAEIKSETSQLRAEIISLREVVLPRDGFASRTSRRGGNQAAIAASTRS